MPYGSIDWNAARNQIAKEDLYYPHPMVQVRPGSALEEPSEACKCKYTEAIPHKCAHAHTCKACAHAHTHTIRHAYTRAHWGPKHRLQDVLWWVLYKAEALLDKSKVRDLALAEIMKHIHYEDENTRYVDIGPVNKVI